MNLRPDKYCNSRHGFGKLNVLSGLFLALCVGLASPQSSAFAAERPQQKRALIIYSFENEVGVCSDFAESLRDTRKASAVGPIGFYTGFLDLVGGGLLPFAPAGAMAAQTGLDVLKGERPADIPILPDYNSRYTFDWHPLRRWHISVARLLLGSFVLYKEPSAWEIYGWRIIRQILLVAAAAMLIVFLLVQRVKRKRAEAGLDKSEARYLAFVANSSESFSRFEADTPMPLALSEDAQIEFILAHAFLAECNGAFARMYGVANPKEFVGARLADLLPASEPENVEFLRAFIRSGYRIRDHVTHERDPQGNMHWFENGVTGIIERDCLVRAWVAQREITDRKRAEAELRESQVLTNSIIDSTSDLIWAVDAERFGLLSFNTVLRDKFLRRGISLRKGMRPEDVCADQDRVARWLGIYQRALSEGSYTTDYESPTGGSMVLAVNLLKRDGKVFGISLFGKDITERKRAEAEIADRLRFESLLAELSSRFVHVPVEQIDGEINHALRRVCESFDLEMGTLWRQSATAPGSITLTHFYGQVGGPQVLEPLNGQELFPWCFREATSGEVVAVSSLEELPPEAARDRESWRQFGIKSNLTVGLAVGGSSIVGALSFNTIQAERAWPEPLVKRLQMVAQIFSNALARQDAERSLRESEERFRSLVENATVGIYRTTPDGRILAANPTLARMLGYADFESLATRNLEEEGFEPSYPRKAFRERIEEEGQVSGLEAAWRRRDSSVIFVRESARAIRGQDGKALYYDGIVEDITERKRVEEALRQRNKYIDTVLENAPIGFAVHTISDGIGRFVSTRFEEIYGVPRGTIDSHYTFFDKVWPYDPVLREQIRSRVVADMESGDPARMHWENVPIQTATGETRYISAVNIPLPEQNLMVSTVWDVTTSRKAEEALQRRAAFDELMTGILSRFATCAPSEVDAAVAKALEGIAEFVGADHAYVVRFSENRSTWSGTHEWCGANVTPRIQHFQSTPFGTVPETEKKLLAGEAVRINSPEDYPPDAVIELRHREVEGHLAALNVPLRTKAGILGNIGLHSHTRPMIWSDDDVVRLRLVGDAVASALERKQAFEELRKSEEMFSTAFHASPVAMTIVSLATGRYLDVNRTFEEITGFRAQDIIGRAPEDLGRPAASKERLRVLETQYRTKSGEVRTWLLSTELIEFGGEVCSLRAGEDITERKRIEQRLRELGARLLMAQETERRRVARELHDDFSQRLALLAIDLERLAQRPPARQEEWRARIQAMWSRTQELTNDIHRLSYQLHPSKLENLGLVAAIRSYCRELSRQAGIEVKFSDADFPRDLPKEISLCVFRIVQEALGNVVKHSGSKTAEVDLSGGANEVCLMVSDAGRGFSMEDAQVTKGLGLVSMQERVRYLGGLWSIDTRPSGGTRVIARIPVPAQKASEDVRQTS